MEAPEQMRSAERITQSARLSFRATAMNFDKLVSIAQAKGWINSKKQPNVSAVLNYLIESFDMALLAPKKREKRNGRG